MSNQEQRLTATNAAAAQLCVAQRRIAELESQLRERSMTERISNTELLIDAALAAQQPGGSDNGR